MSSFSFCFCSFISWQRSIIAAAVGVFSSAVCADCAWIGEQRARAKINARLEQTTSCVFVWFFIFCSSPRFPTTLQFLSTAAPRLALRLGTGGSRQELLATVVTTKVERLSTAFGVDGGCFIYGHAADRVFGHGVRLFHGSLSFLSCCSARRPTVRAFALADASSPELKRRSGKPKACVQLLVANMAAGRSEGTAGFHTLE